MRRVWNSIIGWFAGPRPLKTYTFGCGDHIRYCEIFEPTGVPAGHKLPVVFVLHGGKGNIEIMRKKCGFEALAQREKFIVVYAAGTSPRHHDRLLHWNTGMPGVSKWHREVDDVEYFRRILMLCPVLLSDKIDRQRIYATGISNGACMCYRLAAELSEMFLGIAPVAGQRSFEDFRKPVHPVSVFHCHGFQDTMAPFRGGYRLPSVWDVIEAWREHNGCERTADGAIVGQAHYYHYTAKRTVAEVALWVLKDGAHTWPGNEYTSLYEKWSGVGKTNRDINATKEMWKFFKGLEVKL